MLLRCTGVVGEIAAKRLDAPSEMLDFLYPGSIRYPYHSDMPDNNSVLFFLHFIWLMNIRGPITPFVGTREKQIGKNTGLHNLRWTRSIHIVFYAVNFAMLLLESMQTVQPY